MSWGDPFTGGVVLRRAALQSPNFIHGTQGWAIFADGSAEFHSITIPAGSGGTTGISAYFAASPPASPNVGDLWYNTANGMQLSQWDGSSWVVHLLSTGAIGPGAIVSSQLAPSVTARALGGITTTILASPPSSGNFTGDVWIDASSGYQLKRWDGSAWVPVAWDASNVIQAGTIQALQILAHTITATQIAAGTITANEIHANTIGVGQLQANLIYAGIVDATVVTGATLQNSTGHPKTSINPDGSITITHSTGFVLFKIGPDGTVSWSTFDVGQTYSILLAQQQPDGTMLVYFSATGPSYWSFEGSTQSWAATNATLASSAVWAYDGANSLAITHSGASQPWKATSPAFPVVGGTTVTVAAQLYTAAVVTGVSCSIQFWTNLGGTGAGVGLVSGDAAPFSTVAGTPASLTATGIPVPATARSATFIVQSTQTGAGVMYLDAVAVAGGLAYSSSPAGGVDQFGNPFPQGTNYVGLPGLTNIFGIEDPFGNQLASIDGTGDISGQVLSANTDVQLGGASLLTDILPNYALGVVARGFTPSGAWPSTPVGTTNTPIVELDQTLTAGRGYKFSVIPVDFIPTSAATQYVMQLRATTDGSTPTTSTPALRTSVMACSNAALNHMTPVLDYIPGNLAADTLYRLLVTANVQAGTFQYQGPLEIRIEDLGNWTSQQFSNNGVAFGTGTSGGSTPQSYTETFYPADTYTYDQFGLKNHNGSMYQGAYSGSSYDDHSWIVWANGSLGHGLATVLGYTVQSVKLRLLNLHSWYNSGMTVSLRYGNPGSPGGTGAISGEITSWHINEGQLLTRSLSAAQWSNFTTAGRWWVLRAGSLSLDRYGYFYGGGGSTGSMPQLQVKYTH